MVLYYQTSHHSDEEIKEGDYLSISPIKIKGGLNQSEGC
jgi:hypothetical protein